MIFSPNRKEVEIENGKVIQLEERLEAARKQAKTEAGIRAVALLDDLVRQEPLVAKEVFGLVEEWLRQQIHGEEDVGQDHDWPLSEDLSALASTVKTKYPHEGCFVCRPDKPERFVPKKDKLCPDCTDRIAKMLRGAGVKDGFIQKLFPGLREIKGGRNGRKR